MSSVFDRLFLRYQWVKLNGDTQEAIVWFLILELKRDACAEFISSLSLYKYTQNYIFESHCLYNN